MKQQKEIDKILQNEIGIMKEGTKESFASRACEIQKLQQERQDKLSRIEKGMKDLHDMLREHMSEEMNSDAVVVVLRRTKTTGR